MPILEGTEVTKYFGGLAAVSHVDFHVEQGEIFGLIGPNGAGKSTLLLTIAGVVKAKAGGGKFDRQPILGGGAGASDRGPVDPAGEGTRAPGRDRRMGCGLERRG